MSEKSWHVSASVVLLCLLALPASGQDLVVTEAERTIDLSSQLVKINVKLTFSATKEAKSAIFALEQEVADKVAFIGAYHSGTSSEKTYLRISNAKDNAKGKGRQWNIDFRKTLAPGSSETIEVEVILGKAVEMFPKEINQRDRQLVLYSGNHYIYTPYQVKSQVTKVTLPSTTLESYSKHVKPTSQSGTKITYGPYADVAPFTTEPLRIHVENNNPFLVVTRLERVIEVSMWGNIAIEETVDIRHHGAKLRGSFSRYEYQRENSGVSSVKSFKTVLPASASDVYYRDDIGNISTSALRVMSDAVELELKPRFPLFGGWKTHYFIGYNVPSYEYLYVKGDLFVLNMRLVDHIYDDMLVDEFVLKVVLPEGSKIQKMHTPYPTARKDDALHFTYLDTEGRPVITIENIGPLTEKHIQDFQLEFVFPRSAMFKEPLLLICACLLFFLLTIVYVRLDFSIVGK